METKRCVTCRRHHPRSNFHRNRSRKDGLSDRCKECARAVSKAWRENDSGRHDEHQQRYRSEDLERIREQQRVYSARRYRENRELYRHYRRTRRARLNATGEPPSFEAVQARMALFGNACAYCGGPYEHLDHVVAISRGGTADLGNLAPACSACSTCNKSKSVSHWTSWFRAQSFHCPDRERRVRELLTPA